jgi:glycosyltransferase involved in cell wall biosynthesis
MSQAPRVSVVIPTYERAHLLEATLRPLIADRDPLEIIVADDGSSDATAELVARLARDDARLRLLELENGGAVRARLAGAAAARGEVVLLLDDDVVARAGLVAGHARHHSGARRLVVVGSMPPVLPARRAPGTYAVEIYAREYARHCERWTRDSGSVLRTLWAGNMSLRRDDLAEAAPALADVAAGYHADLDLGLRLLDLGFSGIFDAALAADHRYTRTPAQLRSDARDSGASLRAVHAAHPARLGPLEADFARRDLVLPARALVAAAAGGSS